MELGQLKSAFGTALLPLATELMPSVTESFKEMVKVIGDNKETIKDAVKGWDSALKTVAELLVFIGEQLHVVSERAQANKWLIDNHPGASPLIAVPILGGAVLDKMYGDEYKAYLEEQKALQEKAKAEKEAAAEAEKNKRAQFENATAAKKRAEAEKQAAKAPFCEAGSLGTWGGGSFEENYKRTLQNARAPLEIKEGWPNRGVLNFKLH